MLRGVALLLTVATGFTGLVYEVTWQRYLAVLLGSHSEATAAILGVFLGSLAAGYAIFGRVVRNAVSRARQRGHAPRLLLLYGIVEASIGVYALAFPGFFPLALGLSARLPGGASGLGFALDVGLTALLIGPPSVLMGATIPILTQALARGLADATRFHALVYALNTAGAFAGALAAGFLIVPRLGLDGALWAMAGINLAAGAVFIALGVTRRPVWTPGGDAVAEPAHSGFAPYAGVALLAGFAMMTLQTVLIRVSGLAFGASHFTFAMVVAVFVLCIALGSLAVSVLSRIPAGLLVASQWLLALLLYAMYRYLPDATYWAHALRSVFTREDAAFYPYHLSAFAVLLAVFALPIGLSGALLPLLFHHLRRDAGDLGSVAGRLYGVNTVGSLAGALLGGYALLFWLDLHHVYRIAVAAVAIGAGILSVRVLELPRVAVALLLVGPVLAALVLLPAWEPERMTSGLFRVRESGPSTFAGPDAFFAARAGKRAQLFYDDDPTATVSVGENPIRSLGYGVPMPKGKLSRGIYVNGKPDGNIPVDYPTMGLVAVLPALFADACERAFVIGFGTGVTAGELGALGCTREVVVAEISPAVIEAAPLFDYGNLAASRNPKLRIQRGDAYRSLLRSRGRFDVIVSEPSNPWVTGVEMLFSREFLQAARERLAPGGVYAQWFHTYETDRSVVELVLRTYTSVFDDVAVWYSIGPDLILFGFDRPESALDLDRLERRAAAPDFAAALRRSGVDSLPALLAHELLPVGVLRAAQLSGDVHTLYRPVLSHRAARAFFRGRGISFPTFATPDPAEVGAENSLLRRYLARFDAAIPEDVASTIVREACESRDRGCASLIARWTLEDPDSPALERLREDVDAARWNPALIQQLAALYRGAAPPQDGTPQDALRATTLFVQHYFHGAPFNREALHRVWRSCRDVAGQSCAEARARAEARVGRLDR